MSVSTGVGLFILCRWQQCGMLNIIEYLRVTPPPPLRTAYRPIMALRTAYRHFLASRTAYRLTTKNNHFGRFHLHKEDKITLCCMQMYNHS